MIRLSKLLSTISVELVRMLNYIATRFHYLITDILVNNAGIIRDRSLNKMTDLDWGTTHIHIV